MTRGPNTPLPWRMVAGLLFVSFSSPPIALANPHGGQVRQGQVRIQSTGSQLRIHQQSQSAVIDWQSFSIDRGETTRFIQPNRAAAVLNRVRGDSASQIEGMLRANGKVYLINPNGILVGPNGTIDVGGFVASTLDPGDEAFMRGGDLRFTGGSDAAVVNLGSISAFDGDVVLMGASVLNAGSIRAPGGTAALAAGNDILIAETGEERVFVRGASGSRKAEGVTNTGSIEANVAELKAHGGNLYGMAVKNEGRVAATGVTRQGGQIFLTAKGGRVRSTGSLKATRSDGSGGRVKIDSGRSESRTEIGGTVDASGRAGAGGEIVILGKEIEIFDGALILNDGATMGGSTRIGGGLRGEDPRFANARSVTVGSGALLSANAGASGNGGLVVVFAEGSLVFDGTISARGGLAFGDGGFAELSGKETVRVSNLAGRLDLSAPAGAAGTVLYDPTDIAILPGTYSPIGGSPVTDNTLYAADIAAFLSTANLIVTTASGGGDVGNITMDGSAMITWSSPHELTFLADNDFILSPGAVIHATGAGAFSATATRSISLGNSSAILTNDGDLSLSANAGGTATGNFVGVDVNGGLVQSTGSGSVSVIGRGGTDTSGNQIGVRVWNGGALLGGTSGLVSVTGYGGASSGSGNIGVSVFSSASTRIGSAGADVQVTGTGGTGNAGVGIELGTGNSNGRITAGGLGSVTVHGTGGSSVSNGFMHGILMSSATIDSDGGNVSVTGIGGSGSNPSGDYTGIQMDDSTISAAGDGSVTVNGTAGTAPSSQTLIGVDVRFTSLITSSGGNVTVIGTGGNTTNALLGAGAGIRLIGDGTITAGGNGSVNVIGTGVGGSTVGHEGIVITGSGFNSNLARIGAANGTTAITATSGNGASHALVVGTGTAGRITAGNHNLILINTDSLSVGSAGIVSSGTGNTILNTRSTGTLINLGGPDVLGGSPLTLGLSDAELDRFTAGTLQIGNASSGQITVSNAITHVNHLSLTSGAGVTFDQGIAMDADRNLEVNAASTITLAGANAQLSASGTGAITLTTARNIALGSGSSIATVDGDLTLAANLQPTPTAGDFAGVSLSGATLASTGTGLLTIAGRGGDAANGNQSGLRIGENSSLATAGGALSLTGVSRDAASSGLFFALANIDAGGGVLYLRGTGTGGGDAIHSSNTSGTIGGLPDTVLIESMSGDVTIAGRIRGGDLQLRDSTAFATVAFTLDNPANDVGSLSAIGNNSFGGIGSLFYRDANGFTVSEHAGRGGVTATNSVTLLVGGEGKVVVEQDITSAFGDIYIEGHDLVVDGASVAAGSSGGITLEADRAILVRADSQLSVVDGSLQLHANLGGSPPLPGQFTGITVLGSTLLSSGDGNIYLAGRGGNGSVSPDFSHPGFTSPSSVGVRIAGGSILVASGTGVDAGTITIEGEGGLGASDSAGVVIDGADTLLQTADTALSIVGYGGGNASGFRNRGILVSGATVQAGGSGGLSLQGLGGQGVGMIDGIQLGGNATLQVENGLLRLVGFAGGNLGIGLMATSDSGDIRSVGSGAIEIVGTGSNAAGVNLGNPNAILGGSSSSSLLVDSQGDLVLGRPTSVAGPVTLRATSDEVFVNAPATSTGGNLHVEGFTLTIDAPLSALTGNLTLQFGESDPFVSTPLDGVARVNASLTQGGALAYLGGFGFGDTLTFANHTPSAIELDFDHLSDIENVVGTAFAPDLVRGPATAAHYEFLGNNQFSVGGVHFSAFENVLGGGGDDTFSFSGSATLSGALDGGGGTNTLDYTAYGNGVNVNLASGGATGVVGGFSNLTSFNGSGNLDTIAGRGSASLYEINAPDSFQVGSASVTGFENLVGGPLNDRFVFLPGASLTGTLDGGGGADTLDYSAFGAPVAIQFAAIPRPSATGIGGGFARIGEFIGSAATTNTFFGPNAPTIYQITGTNAFSTPLFRATSFQNLRGGNGADRFLMGPGASLTGRLSGGAGNDTLSYASFGRPVTVEIGPNTATGLGSGFAEMETIRGSSGNDRFRFLNQATIGLVDGGAGTDLLEIDDTTLGGNQTYTVAANSITRNPVYHFRNFEAVRLFLGSGNNTVNGGFFAFDQFLHAGNGFNTLNLPGVTTLNGSTPVRNVNHFGFDAPRSSGTDTGGLLQLEVDQRGNGTGLPTHQNFQTENRFSIVDPTTLNSPIGALGNAFSAAIVAQAVVVSVEGNSYLVLRPFSLDGSGLQPSNLGLAAMQEHLGIEANLELAAAIGFDGAIFLFNPDGPFALDLSGVPADPAILALLNESLSIAAAAELSAALGLDLVVSILASDGIVPVSLDGGAPGAGVVALLTEQLSDPAAAELNAALTAGN